MIFDVDYYTNDLVDYSTSILDELTYYPYEDYELIKLAISFEVDFLPYPSSSLKYVQIKELLKK